ncbi:MAG: UPF0149 family protein [Legionellales bacterium]|nr:UPF0149 family protein [Legionellales bacterium]
MNTPNYHDVKHALLHAHNLITPAELHGILCGLVCAGLKKLDENSVSDILMLDLADETDTDQNNLTLNALFGNTKQKIEQFELDFQLLLPDDDLPLGERAFEFGKWCEGFLAGIGLSNVPHTYRDQAEVDDILHKLSEASRIEFRNLDFSEEDEQFFYQVTEFVRLSVFAIYQELTGDAGDNQINSSYNKTLH